MEADVKSHTKIRKRTENAAVDQAKHVDKSSSARVNAVPTCSTSFGIKAEPPTHPLRDDALVDKGAAAPKPHLSPVEMRTLTAAGGLLPAGTASSVMRTIFPRPLFLEA